jgi:hypothetical protein
MCDFVGMKFHFEYLYIGDSTLFSWVLATIFGVWNLMIEFITPHIFTKFGTKSDTAVYYTISSSPLPKVYLSQASLVVSW